VGSKYLAIRYSEIAELNSGTPVTSPQGSFPNYAFHSIPLNDAWIGVGLVNAYVHDNRNPDFDFAGYVGPLPQINGASPNTAQVMGINYIAKAAFSPSSYNVTGEISQIDKPVCLRGSTGVPPTCTPFNVNAGDIKMAFGLYNWQFDSSATTFRIQYQLQPVGFTSPTVFFNGNPANHCNGFSGTITSLTVSETGGVDFTLQLQNQVNKGDNTFITAAVTSSYSGGLCMVNIDVPVASLTTGPGTWFLYDPVVQQSSGGGPGSGVSSSTGAGSNAGERMAAVSFAVVMAVLFTAAVLMA